MSSFTVSGEPGSLKALCEVSKKACDILTPMIVQFYNAINGDTAKLKEDKSVFTIADGTVQHLLVEHLYSGGVFRGIVGEEECEVDLVNRPFKVDGLTIPEEFCDMIEKVRDDIKTLREEHLKPCELYKTLTIFIDPIDGTREFSTNLGEQCSVCIGFSDLAGLPQAGVVYRPITVPATWAAGAKSENYKDSVLNTVVEEGTPSGGLLTSNGGISKWIECLMKEMDYARVPSGGAGNKMLMLLEGKGGAYIQDRGVSRWDTAGAQACIEANGGILCKLSSFVAADSVGAIQSYTYLMSERNLDFESGVASITPYNAVDKALAPKKGAPAVLATNIADMKAYSNLNGLLAIGASLNNAADLAKISEACQRAKAINPPSFD
jgi:3'(2'), 5'-bisphosphate nucleotidase